MTDDLFEWDNARDDAFTMPLDMLVSIAVRLIVRKHDFPDLVQWMITALGNSDVLTLEMKQAFATDEEFARPMAHLFARAVWNATPQPDLEFRVDRLPSPGRNSSCPCGSQRKYKKCCAAAVPPGMDLPQLSLLGHVLDNVARKQWKTIPFKNLSLDEVAFTAGEWRKSGRTLDAVQLLEALFASESEPDHRFEMAFDELMECYLELNKPRKRAQLLNRCMNAGDPQLRAAAMQRQCTMLADRGEWEAAWEIFRQAQRLLPNDPSLAHLEVLLLFSQDRADEARSRAQFWSARLTRLGPEFADLAELMTDFATQGDARMLAFSNSGEVNLKDLLDCVQQLPPPVGCYALDPNDGQAGPLSAQPALLRLENEWLSVYDSVKPSLTSMVGDNRTVWEDAEHWIGWLLDHPDAFDSFDILDDVVMAIDTRPAGIAQIGSVIKPLLLRAERLLRATLEQHDATDCKFEWGWTQNRSALRLVARLAIDLDGTDDARALDVLVWVVTTLNPIDNHGLREALVRRQLRTGHPREALAVLARYSDDALSALLYARSLALFLLDDFEPAKEALRAARLEAPKVWKMLTAKNPRPPRDLNPGFIDFRGDDEAWYYREDWLSLWESSGALAWGRRVRP